MEKIINIKSINEYNNLIGIETLHPLISIVDFEKSEPFCYFKSQMAMYAVFLKDSICGNMTYGCSSYDYEEGTILFLAPNQVYGVASETKQKGMGKALVFHPDLIHGTSLGRNMKDYSFFAYNVNEALHVSTRERAILNDCLDKIGYELEHAIDKHSKTLIVSYLELFLNYCQRFYDRQFITRSHVNKDLLTRFEQVLNDYFNSDQIVDSGLPTVRYCADKLFLSANYLGDLLKKETGKSAQEHIQLKLIEVAKEKIYEPGKSISEIAFELGFKYPQHFIRMFKKETGYTPTEYRSLN
ncbi:MAG: helix-turn-helix domain-containing protein [Paludibacter sp.]